ncbi:hypothetical protein JVT61DRAFT_1870 [Boletus reticuloceps]|uniref:Uncharacterized protein n=1 Tax=Boletus reticuloceps TaxID=495285 RepID=A0A8I2YBX8_9AGAM|nr:hypothetical protein JVT61DRAFT_1870 [Boletus reticuloceps]
MPSLSGKGISIPCITFKLGCPTPMSGYPNVFQAHADGLGIVEITTTEDLSRLDSLYLVHPWIDFLLDRRHVQGGKNMLAEEVTADGSLLHDSPPLPAPSTLTYISQLTPAVVSRLLANDGTRHTQRAPSRTNELGPCA